MKYKDVYDHELCPRCVLVSYGPLLHNFYDLLFPDDEKKRRYVVGTVRVRVRVGLWGWYFGALQSSGTG